MDNVEKINEPFFADTPLSEWVECLAAPYSQQNKEQAITALQQIGTEAIPYLLQWLKYAPAHEIYDIPSVLDPYRDLPGKEKRGKDPVLLSCGSVYAFRLLGASAGHCIPDLMQIASDTRYSLAVENAVIALECIGDLAIPSLIELLLKDNIRLSSHVLLRFSCMGMTVRPAIPAIVAQIKGSNEMVAAAAADIVAGFPLDHDILYPVIMNALYDTRPKVRQAAVKGVYRLEEKAAPYLAALMDRLNDEVYLIACDAAAALGHVRLQPSLVVPALTKALQNDNIWVRNAIIDALKYFGPDARSALPAIRAFQTNPRLSVSVGIAIRWINAVQK